MDHTNPLSDIYGSIYKCYGIRPLTVDEEINYPKFASQTRRNKMEIIDMCKHAHNLLDTIEWRAKNAPELDDATHAALVQKLSERVIEACKAIEIAARVGY